MSYFRTLFLNKNMRNISDTIFENAEIKGLKPVIYFNTTQFFETMTDPNEQRFITASYKRTDNIHYVFFFYKNKQIGYVKLKPINPLKV